MAECSYMVQWKQVLWEWENMNWTATRTWRVSRRQGGKRRTMTSVHFCKINRDLNINNNKKKILVSALLAIRRIWERETVWHYRAGGREQDESIRLSAGQEKDCLQIGQCRQKETSEQKAQGQEEDREDERELEGDSKRTRGLWSPSLCRSPTKKDFSETSAAAIPRARPECPARVSTEGEGQPGCHGEGLPEGGWARGQG